MMLVLLVVPTDSRFDEPSTRLHIEDVPSTGSLALQRKIYRFSVIPGGVYSADELARAQRVDATVRAHYTGFGNAPTLHVMPAMAYFYVSYRKGDRIYWTSNKRPIPKGELVLSDGKNLARARCGNRLSLVAQEPRLEAGEPSDEFLNDVEAPTASVLDSTKPPLSFKDLSLLPSLFEDQLNPNSFGLSVPGNTALTNRGFADLLAPSSGFLSTAWPLVNPRQGDNNRTITDIPEPSTSGMLLAALAVALLYARAKMARRQSQPLDQ